MASKSLFYLSVAVALILVAVFTVQGAIATVAIQREVQSDRARQAEAMRWSVLAKSYTAGEAVVVGNLQRGRHADSLRWNALAQRAAAPLRARNAEAARWSALARRYLELNAEKLERGRRADSLRWHEISGSYAAVQRARSADALRWSELARSYFAEQRTRPLQIGR